MIEFVVEFDGEHILLDDIEIPSLRRALDPIRSELIEKLATALPPGSELSVVFTIEVSGEVGIEFRGDSDLIDQLDDMLEDVELSDPEDR